MRIEYPVLIALILILFPVLASAQPQCLTNADTDCDMTVNVTELTSHINAWYACSACVPDIFQSLQAYFGIPFCGDWECNATVGEDCSSCLKDCNCSSGLVCQAGVCVAAGNCSDGIRNQDEAGIDCGGACIAGTEGICSDGIDNDNDCLFDGNDSDCASGYPTDYIAFYRFEGNTNDETGNYDGTWMGDDEVYVDGQIGQALEFDGDADYVNIGTAISPASAISVSLWFKADSLDNYDTLIRRVDPSFVGGGVWLGYNSDNLYFWINHFSDYDASIPFADTTSWHHVAGTYDGSTVSIYLDGTKGADASCSEAISYAGSPAWGIGDSTAHETWPFQGSIDEVMIFNRSLSHDEILQIYDGSFECAVDSDCDDGNGCTINVCNSSDHGADLRGCVAENVGLGTACDDGLFCTGSDTTCDGAGSCIGGTPVDCSDGVGCTDDICVEATGSYSCSAVPNDADCNVDEVCDALLGCMPDPCAGISQCSNYNDSVSCDNNNCSVGGGCAWNVTSGVCGDSAIPENAIFIDNNLTSDCVGTYSITSRDCSGSDGDAYDTPQEAADIVNPGDVVLFREGTYTQTDLSVDTPVMLVLRSGISENPITFKNYNNEEVIFSGMRPGDTGRAYSIVLGIEYVWGQDISGQGVQNIIIDGIAVEGASGAGLAIYGPVNRLGTAENPTENVTVRNVVARNNQAVGDGLAFGIRSIGTSVNLVIENCEAYGNHGGGIVFWEVDRPWHEAEPDDDMSSGQHCAVRNCLSYSNIHPTRAGDSDGIQGFFMYRCILENNIVFGNGDDGLDMMCSIECTARNNIAFNQNNPAGNGGGIKFATCGGGGHTIAGNAVFNNRIVNFDQWGPDPWNQHREFYPSHIYNNLAFGSQWGFATVEGDLINFDYDPDFPINVFRNNIGSDNTNYDIFNTETFDETMVDSDYNFWSLAADFNYMQAMGLDLNSFTGDPGLADEAAVIDTNFGADWTTQQKLDHIRSQVNSSFNLATGSQLIDAGVVVPGYHCATAGYHPGEDCREWHGTAPDIGAYEYQ